ncbi:MAG: hypothetical protein WAW92_04580 [Minisyncoccia bacterium]
MTPKPQTIEEIMREVETELEMGGMSEGLKQFTRHVAIRYTQSLQDEKAEMIGEIDGAMKKYYDHPLMEDIKTIAQKYGVGISK